MYQCTELGTSSNRGSVDDMQRHRQWESKLDKGVENEKPTNEKPDEDFVKENPTPHTPNHFQAVA